MKEQTGKAAFALGLVLCASTFGLQVFVPSFASLAGMRLSWCACLPYANARAFALFRTFRTSAIRARIHLMLLLRCILFECFGYSDGRRGRDHHRADREERGLHDDTPRASMSASASSRVHTKRLRCILGLHCYVCMLRCRYPCLDNMAL